MSSNACSAISAQVAPVTWKPSSLEEASQCLRTAAADGMTVAITGSGTAWSWGGDVAADVVIHTRRLASVLQHEPSDMTIRVGAGMPVTELQAMVAEHGQRLALDAGRIARGATVGGILATADQGPAQLAFGGPRDLVIGATLILADGSVAKVGGNVIKNVAGYDLARLVSGSLGTLAVIADLTFRLHPLPETTGTVVADADVEVAGSLAERIMAAGLDPVALEWNTGQLLVRIEGTESGVAARLIKVAQMLGPDSRLLAPDEAAVAWSAHGNITEPPEPGTEPFLDHGPVTVIRGLVRPTNVSPAVAAASRIGRECQLNATIAAGLLTGRVDLRLIGGDLAGHGQAVTRWRRRLDEMSGTSVLRERAPSLTRFVDAWGTPPSAVFVMRAVKSAFDPGDRLGRGRFQPWFPRVSDVTDTRSS